MSQSLKDYLEATGESAADFARRAGVSPEAVLGVLKGEGACDATLARRIVAASDGQVPFDTLFGDKASIVDFLVRQPVEPLDRLRLQNALAIALELLAADCVFAAEDIALAAEAADNAFAALAGVTARQGPRDRLAQALQTIVEGILEDYSVRPPHPDRLEEACRRAAAQYRRKAGKPSG